MPSGKEGATMNRKISLGAAISFLLIGATITFCLTMVFSNRMFNDKIANVKEREQMYEKLAELDTLVRSRYYGEIDTDALFDGLRSGYLDGMENADCQYLDAEAYQNYLKQTASDVVGIGVVAYLEPSGYLQVAQVQEGSPAAENKIQAGDLIIAVNGEACTPETGEKLLASLQDKPGTTLALKLRRNGEDLPELELVRKQFEIKTVLSKKLPGSVGYLRIYSFNDHTAAQVKTALEAFAADKEVTSVIFDLRDNQTGTLEQAAKVLQQLVPEGPIALAEKKDKTTEVLYKSTAVGISLPAAVLINEQTAMGAELFAIALQDYGKATLVGSVTAGKGVVQELFAMSDGSAVWLATARLLSPKGKSFQDTGVQPDYLQPLTEESADVINQISLEADAQLKKAYDVLQGTVIKDDSTPTEK